MAIALYDNRCESCARFAKMVGRLSQGGIKLVGLYTNEGEKLQTEIGYGARDMFWFVKDGTAYGGRASLLPLITEIIRSENGSWPIEAPGICMGPHCGTLRNAVMRTVGLLVKSRKVRLGNSNI